MRLIETKQILPHIEKRVRFSDSRYHRHGQVVLVGELRRTTVAEDRYWQGARILSVEDEQMRML